MSKKTHDAISRSDRVLVAAMAIILATASAAIGASMTYRPSTDKPVAPAVKVVEAAPKPVADTVSSRLLAEHKCLAEVLYYEARGEGAGGQKAIAEVVFHRMRNGNYGNSICAVVYEGAGRPSCQFSFTCNGDMRRAKDIGAWRNAEPAAFSQAWLARAHSVGTPLEVHAGPGERISGTFDGIEPDGAMRLRRDDGTVDVVRAGDVTLR